MEAIARRALVALFFASPRDEMRAVLASMATDLSAGNIAGFMSLVSKEMAERDVLGKDLEGLISAYDVNSSIELQNVEGQTAQVDWYLALRSRSDNAVAVQRREVIAITFTQVKKRWRVASFSKPDFFRP
jgi:hypothetical protein